MGNVQRIEFRRGLVPPSPATSDLGDMWRVGAWPPPALFFVGRYPFRILLVDFRLSAP
jgi:hypothetical protein